MTTRESTRPQVTVAGTGDTDRVVAVIALAFAADPFVRWMYPHPHQYLTHWATFVLAFGGKGLEHGSANYVGGFAGAALWLPPGIQPDEERLVTLLEQSVAADQQKDMFAILEQMSRYHPTEPHWYLPLIGVDPQHQGKGYGSALLGHTLARCDRDGTPAYLESSNSRNVPLYERHGFEVIGTIQAGTSPSMLPMVRKPR